MPWEESRERMAQARWNEQRRVRGVSREEGAGVRDGLREDIRTNGRFNDQTGIPLWGLFSWLSEW